MTALKSFSVMTAASIALSACGTFGFGSRDAETKSAAVETVKSIEDTRVLITPTCLKSEHGKEFLAIPILTSILSSVVPSLVEGGLDKLKEWMEKRAKEYSTTYSSRGASTFYEVGADGKVDKRPGCITVVRGQFGPYDGNSPPPPPPFSVTDLRQLGLVEPPSFYFEANIAYSADGAMRLKPDDLYFRERAAKRAHDCEGHPAGCKTINITITLEKPAEDKSDPQALGVAAFAFKRVAVGSYLPYTVLASSTQDSEQADTGQSSQWIAIPAAPDKSTIKTLEGNSDVADRRTGAFSVLATVNETEDDDDFLLFLAGVLDQGKTDIAKAISDPIVAALKPKAKK